MEIPDILITGGQTGADMGALLAAKALNIPTGGYAPDGFKTESGPRPDLGAVFGLVETDSADYKERTCLNVEMCDALIVIARDFRSPGTRLTVELATLRVYKPCFQVQFPSKASGYPLWWFQDLQVWLDCTPHRLLMVAGNRESKAPGIEQFTKKTIYGLFLGECA